MKSNIIGKKRKNLLLNEEIYNIFISYIYIDEGKKI